MVLLVLRYKIRSKEEDYDPTQSYGHNGTTILGGSASKAIMFPLRSASREYVCCIKFHVDTSYLITDR